MLRFRLSLPVILAAFSASSCVHNAPSENIVGDYLSGRLAASANDVDAAASAFTDAQSEVPGAADILRNAFFFKLAAGKIDEATPLAERLVSNKDYGDDGLARIALAARALRTKNYAQVRTLLSEGVEAGFLLPIAHIFEAWAIEGAQGPDAAYEFLLTAEEGENKSGFEPLHLAFFADLAGRQEDAHAAYDLAVRTLGGPVGRLAYGVFLERKGDEELARNYYTQLLHATGPERQAALQGLARLDRGAVSHAFERTSPTEGAAIALFSLGAAIQEQAANERDAAARAGFRVGDANYNLPLLLMQLALYLDPNFDVALRFAGTIMNFYGENDHAIDMLSRIRPSSPYYEQAQIDIASGLLARNNRRAAIAVLRRAIGKNKNAYEARSALANLLVEEGKYEAAVDMLDTLIDGLPAEAQDDAWRFYIARAAALMEINEWPRAEADLKRAVELAPEEPTALNYLGYSWAERGENLDEAFKLIEKAVSLQPNSGAIIDSLGWAHYQRGQYEDAVGHLEQAASLEPSDPVITEHLGDVYWRLGRKTEARYQWARALELDPDDKQIPVLKDKLDRGLPEKESGAQE